MRAQRPSVALERRDCAGSRAARHDGYGCAGYTLLRRWSGETGHCRIPHQDTDAAAALRSAVAAGSPSPTGLRPTTSGRADWRQRPSCRWVCRRLRYARAAWSPTCHGRSGSAPSFSPPSGALVMPPSLLGQVHATPAPRRTQPVLPPTPPRRRRLLPTGDSRSTRCSTGHTARAAARAHESRCGGRSRSRRQSAANRRGVADRAAHSRRADAAP